MGSIRGRKTFAAALFLVVLSSVGCTSDAVDGVLWRQVAAFKDPLGTALNHAIGAEPSALAADLRGRGTMLPGGYWDGTSGHADLGLDSGALVFSNVREGPEDLKLDVLIGSGPRDAAGDRVADTSPYAGPSSIYTCFAVIIDSTAGAIAGWTYVDADCEPKLVATLSDEARFYPVADFDG